MSIDKHTLEGSTILSCTKNKKALKNLKFIVIHATATTKTEPTVRFLRRADTGASVHLVIGRDGKVIQLVPFNIQAWHAGESTYRFNNKQYNYLNNYSIGIELVNACQLKYVCGTFYSIFDNIIPEECVFFYKKDTKPTTYWHKYTDEQISSLIKVCKTLIKDYPQIKQIIGHSDITTRKIDPGKAFPWDRLLNAINIENIENKEDNIEETKT